MKRRIFLALLFFGTVVLTLLDGYFYLANRGFTPWMDDESALVRAVADRLGPRVKFARFQWPGMFGFTITHTTLD